jgi:enterochelin esterase-like enzyme
LAILATVEGSSPLAAKRTSIMVFFLLLFSCNTRAATDSELVFGKPLDGAVAVNKPQSYSVLLKAGDFVEVRVQPHGAQLVLIAYGPGGNKVSGAKFGPEEGTFDFVAEGAGKYHLELAPEESTKEGSYTITLTKTVALEDRLKATPLKYESPRIKSLRAAVESGRRESVAAFWDEVKEKGAPFIERLQSDDKDKDDEKNMLVTFLWRGTPETQNVMVLWFPFSVQWPDDYRMNRLGETDVWYKTLKVDKRKRFIYRIVVNAPALHASQEPPPDDTFTILFASSRIDPLNANHWAADASDPDVPEHQGFSAVDMPNAPEQPWGERRKGVLQGKVERHELTSALLKNEREIGVYLPPGYSKTAKPYGLVVLFDENAYLKNEKQSARVPTETILDNLIAEQRIPPVIALFIDNGPGDARSHELPCNATFADFLDFELVPWARRSYNVTSDPRQTLVGGSSYGGLAATWAGWRHPETFGNILSQSGSYWWTPPKSSNSSDFDSDAEPNWMAKQFIASPRLPLRFYMDAGSDEIDLSGHGNSILLPNRNLRDVLLAKGYEVHYQEFIGGHDYLSWRGTLADGLILLLGSGATEAAHEARPEP